MPHTTEIPVTWGDTDAGGLIYYPRFFHFAVVGLNAYFQPAFDGHLMENLRTEGRTLPAIEATASFEAPLQAGDTAAVESTVSAGETSLTLEYAVTRADDGRPAATGETTFVLVDGAFEPVALPGAIHDCIRQRGDTEG